MTKQPTNKDNINEPLNTSSVGWIGYVPYFIAIGVLVAYVFFISFLIGKVGSKELDWSRLIYLFTGVEAIVFAAAGFLFGREVNRKRAENAEVEKKIAEERKEEATEQMVEERQKGLILGAMAIQAEKTVLGTTGQSTELEGVETRQSPMANVAIKARKMYPELNDAL